MIINAYFEKIQQSNLVERKIPECNPDDLATYLALNTALVEGLTLFNQILRQASANNTAPQCSGRCLAVQGGKCSKQRPTYLCENDVNLTDDQMAADAMSFVERDDYVLSFHINLAEPSCLEQLGFIILLEAKFDANRRDIGHFHGDEDIHFGSVELQFPSLKEFMDALSHCRNHLTGTGRVSKSYRGALDTADRGGRQAKALLAELETLPFSN